MKAHTETPTIQAEQRLAIETGHIIASIGTGAFFKRLTALLRQRAESDSIAILSYHRHYAPQILYEELSPRDKDALYAHYFEDAYLLSPFYLRWLADIGQSALYRLQEISPEGFFDSIYYTTYYHRSGLLDELGYIISVDDDTGLLISLGRSSDYQAYSIEERSRLHNVEAIVSNVMRLHYSIMFDSPSSRMKKKMADTLLLFGSEILTEKEKSVVQMMLRGHSSKSCARELGISPTTERVHRRNIYAKLNISSQAELFTRFFDALAD